MLYDKSKYNNFLIKMREKKKKTKSEKENQKEVP